MSSENTIKVLILGGSVEGTPYHVSNLLGKDHGPILASFLEQAYRTLRSEIVRLPNPISSQITRFSSIHALCALQDQNKLHPSLTQPLTCVSQLAYVIRICERDHGLYLDPTNTLVAGLDIGALSAAAVCASQNLTQLLNTAIEVVRVAFRMAVTALDLARSIEPQAEFEFESSSWTLSISELSSERASTLISEVSGAKGLPIASQLYISAVADAGVSISGPPRILAELQASPAFQGLKAVYSPITAPYHAPHLFSKRDVARIISDANVGSFPTYLKHLDSLCPWSGTLSWSQTFRSLLEEAVAGVLLEPVREDLVRWGLEDFLHPLRSSHIEVLSLSARNSLGNLYAGPQASSAPPSVADQPISKSKIAIVGFSGRFPNADNLSEFWDLLSEGRDVHKVVPPTRWDANTHVDTTGQRKNTSATPFGCWLDKAGLFDAKFFHLSPREAPQVDPAQRLALLTAYEAIEQAGIVPGATPSTQKDRVGVFYGVTSNDWMETNSSQNIDTYMIPGGNRAFIPGRINYFFKFSGPSYSIDTACSSSLASIHAACNSLWRGDVDTAIAGGTNVLTNPDFTSGLDRGHFLSRTGNCKSFDDGADGYCRGEGVVTVILKRYEDAVADRDPIHGLILSAYTNHSADAESITRPHGGAQKAIFNKLLYDTSTNAYDVSYVEMHGRGTQAGDAEEMRSVLEIFAPEMRYPIRSDGQALYLGSVKANIGHGEAASGVSSLAKVLLMMKNNTIPPHCGIKTKLNHKFPDYMGGHNVRIASKPTAWHKPATGTRKVLVNNFSAAGGNSALLLEDAPLAPFEEDTDSRTHHCVAISAKSTQSLQGNIESLLDHLENAPAGQLTLPTLSYTTTARRIHHMFRVMVSGSQVSDIRAQLLVLQDKTGEAQRIKTEPRLIFAFTGQGSQYSGMGKQFYRSFSSFRYDLDRLDQLTQQLGFPSFIQVINDEDRPIEDYSPVATQVATTCLEIALARLWKSWGIVPAAVVGHSLGEYAALHIAGVLSECDTIYLVAKRAQLLEQYCTPGTHSMLAVQASLSVVENLTTSTGCEVACVNGLEDVVLSGETRNIKQARDILSSHNVKATLLRVPYAFHSSQVDPIRKKLTLAAANVTLSEPKIPVICATNATIVKDGKTFNPTYFSTHCREPVNMLGAAQIAKQSGIIDGKSILIEVGHQPVVSNMFNASLKTTLPILPSLQRGQDTWKLLTSAFTTLYTRGSNIDWREYHRDFKSSHKVLELPAYSWELRDYWLQYTNDWSLYKGEAPKGIATSAVNDTRTIPAPQAPPQPTFKRLETTTVNKVLEEDVRLHTGRLVVEGDISGPGLNPLVQGHKVNGIPLCTPSVYAELALTIGTYLLERYQPTMKERLIDVSDMIIEKALIAQNSGSQILRTSVNIDWAQKLASVTYESYHDSSKKLLRHATCKIRFRDAAQERSNLAKKAASVKDRVASLKKDLAEGKIYRFNRAMIYKMVGALAQFDSKYTGLKEIVLDSNALEAYGSAEFSNVNSVGDFYTHPAYIDAVSQIGGFVMNCNDNTNLDEEVFINHGWRSFQLFEKLSQQKLYELHVSMHETPGNKWEGDITIFDGPNAVACFEGITLQGVAKRALHYILAREKDLGALPGAKGRDTKSDNVAEAKAATAIAPAPAHTRITVVPTLSAPPVAQAPAPTLTNRHQSVVAPPAQPKSAHTINAAPRSSEKLELALQIISEESGIPLAEMTDNVEFSECGIDSLLVLIIASRFDEELGINIDSAEFCTMPTIGALKQFIISLEPESSTVKTPYQEVPPQQLPPAVHCEVKFAPSPHVVSAPAAVPLPVIFALPDASAPPAVMKRNSEIEGFQEALHIISEESGVAVEDLTDDTEFGDIGVDSLLSLIIVSRFKEEISVDLDSDVSLFVQFPTVRAIRLHFESEAARRGGGTSQIPSAPEFPSPPQAQVFTPPSVPNVLQHQFQVFTPQSTPGIMTPWSRSPSDGQQEKREVKPASSVILQGKPRLDPETLILLPDGGGSAASYARLPRIKPGLAVIGLNCPYARCPAEMTCDLEDLIDSYLAEIRKRQPQGPYNVGGWSSGGILAYKVAQRLIQGGEEVMRLVLIDSPPPLGLGRLSQPFYDFCGSVNLFDSTKNNSSQPSLSAELLAHFESTIEALHDFYADPLPEGLTPLTTIIWAAECVFDGVKFSKLPPGPDDTEGMKFLTEKRTDFTAGAWADFFPGEEITVDVIEGATHFSMMGEFSAKLAECIAKAMR